MLRSSSPAVQWAEFFGVSQGQDECISDYFVRGAQKVNDCAFECPQCSLNLSEYLLLKKLVVGIRDTGLKQQVYQACDSLGSVDALRAMCCAYEAARQHTTGVGGWRESSRAAGTVRAEENGDQTLDAAAGPLPLPLARHSPHVLAGTVVLRTPLTELPARPGKLSASPVVRKATSRGAAGAPSAHTALHLPTPSRDQ